jgi:hypothetical protein
MSHLDDAFSLGTFETGSFGARFKICFDREPRAEPVCFDVGAHGERELFLARDVAGEPSSDPADMRQIATQDNWAGTQKTLRWLRSQSQPTMRGWFRENGFEPFIDQQISSAGAHASR